MRIDVTFPAGVSVDAHCNGHRIHTDQPETAGGEGSGPSPFDLFLASLATCGGYYALQFCRERRIDTAGLGLALEARRAPDTRRLSIRIGLELPEGFPEKYEKAILRAVDQCSVKRQLREPPEIELAVADR